MTRLPTILSCAIVAALGCATMTLTGCAKPKGLTTEQRINLLPIDASEWRRLGYRWDWKVAPALAIDEQPVRTVASGDLLLTQTSRGEITAFSTSGERIWNTNLANQLTRYTGLAVTGDRVVVSSQAEVFGVDAKTGELTIRQRYGTLVNTPPIVLGDVVVVGSNSGELFGHFLATGFKAWGHGINGVFERKPVLVDGIVGAVNSKGQVIFVDPVSFRQTSQSTIYDGPGAALAAGGGLMYVASLDQSLWAFNPRERAAVWRHKTPDPLRDDPVYHDGVVYCSFRESGLTALDAATGEVLWSNPDQRGHVIGTRNDRLLVWDDERLSLVDPQRGVILDVISVPNVFEVTNDSFEDGNLYLTSSEGVVARFVPVS